MWTKAIALIPARKGSKGVVGKNTREVLGRPLIGYTIAAAKNSHIDEVVVSSNDELVQKVAEAENVEFLLRPEALCSDTASAYSVIQHFIDVIRARYGEESGDYLVVYLQPTSPLRNEQHINDSLELMQRLGTRSCISVCDVKDPPYKYFKLDVNGRLDSLFEEELTNARRQDLPQTYKPNGAIYLFYVKDFLAHQAIPSNGGAPYIMSTEDSVDIDEEKDIEVLTSILLGRKGG